MEFTVKTVVLLVVIIIMALTMIGLILSWGNSSKGLLDSFFGWIS